jgi:hypothetical protein
MSNADQEQEVQTSQLNDFEQIELLLASVRGDANKFYVRGNNSAGTRLRKVLLELKNLCHSSRKNVQNIIKDRKQEKKAPSDEHTSDGSEKVVVVKTVKPKKTKPEVSEKCKKTKSEAPAVVVSDKSKPTVTKKRKEKKERKVEASNEHSGSSASQAV